MHEKISSRNDIKTHTVVIDDDPFMKLFSDDRGLIHVHLIFIHLVNGSHKITHLHLILCDVNV